MEQIDEMYQETTPVNSYAWRRQNMDRAPRARKESSHEDEEEQKEVA